MIRTAWEWITEPNWPRSTGVFLGGITVSFAQIENALRVSALVVTLFILCMQARKQWRDRNA